MKRTDLHSYLLEERLRLNEAIGLAKQALVFLTDEQRAYLEAQIQKVDNDFDASVGDFKHYANAVIAEDFE